MACQRCARNAGFSDALHLRALVWPSASLARAGAQTIETPVPFDSAASRARRSRPALAERLRLGRPAWPVRDEYRESTSIRQSQGGFVLVGRSPTGALERYELTRSTARCAGRGDRRRDDDVGPTERPESAPSRLRARGKWLRADRSRALTALGYARWRRRSATTASVARRDLRAHDRCRVLHLVRRGAERSDHARPGRSCRQPRRRGGCRGDRLPATPRPGTATEASERSASGQRSPERSPASSSVRHLTDAEAHSATLGIEGTAASAWAIAAGAGARGRGMAAIVAASEPLGYVLGLQYPRMASYGVTAGDVERDADGGTRWRGCRRRLDRRGTPEPSQDRSSVRRVLRCRTRSSATPPSPGRSTSRRPMRTSPPSARSPEASSGLAIPLIAQTDNGSVIFGVGGGRRDARHVARFREHELPSRGGDRAGDRPVRLVLALQRRARTWCVGPGRASPWPLSDVSLHVLSRKGNAPRARVVDSRSEVPPPHSERPHETHSARELYSPPCSPSFRQPKHKRKR